MRLIVTRVLAATAVVLLVLALYDAYRLVNIRAWNASISSGRVLDASNAAPEEARFARAHELAMRGEVIAALTQYRQLADTASAARRQAALFNASNVLLREGLKLRATAHDARAGAVLEMSKESYRELLRQYPDHWDAKYNLEVALRLAPEPDDVGEEDLPPPPAAPRQAPSFGSLPGLP